MTLSPCSLPPTAPPTSGELPPSLDMWPAVLIPSYEKKRAEEGHRLAAEFAKLERMYDLAS